MLSYTYSQEYLLTSPLKSRRIDELSMTTDLQDEEVSKMPGYGRLFAMGAALFPVSSCSSSGCCFRSSSSQR
jgi:hypothetical protein